MKREYVMIEEHNLQEQLECLNKMKAEITALKEDIDKRQSAKYLTIPQLCDFLHVSRSSIYRMVRAGELKMMKIRRRSLFALKDVEKLLITINQ